MRGRERLPVLAAVALTIATGELARRLLSPGDEGPTPVPVDVRDHFSADELARGRAFARHQQRLTLARATVQTVLLIAAVRRPPAALTRERSHPVRAGAIGAAGLALALDVPQLPLRALAHRRSVRAGLSTQTWSAWALDLGKVAAIEEAFSGALGAGAIALSRRWPGRWWLPAAAIAGVVAALAGALAPLLLEPLFNDFDPLPEGETRADVLALAADAGVSVGEVHVVDASRRTTAANAYVSGLGPTRRVVLYDTMLERYSRDEIRLVVAHELGHVRHRDVTRNLTFAALLMPAAIWGVARSTTALAGLDADAPLGPAALPALTLASGLVSLPLAPIAARLSRAMERRADHFSLMLAGAPEAFISFERGAALQNLADLQPRWLSRQLASHPPTSERIGAALAFAESSR